MKTAYLLLLIGLLVIAAFLPVFYVRSQVSQGSSSQNLLYGVTFGGDTFDQAKLLIDRVKGFTNLLIVDSWQITGASNETILDEVCQYAVDAGLSIIVYFNFIFYNYTRTYGTIYNATSWNDYGIQPWHMPWLNAARYRWGDKFLGIYLYDEPGGKQVDTGFWRVWTPPRNTTTYVNVTSYTEAARNYSSSFSHYGDFQHLTNTSIAGGITKPMPVFTSDYALYWFDYEAGYNTVFVEVGGCLGTDFKMQQIALCRGAADVQGKDWGAIITWASNCTPYLESGASMLQDMIRAYNAGAKYIIVFNYPQINPYGALIDDQFAALETFWNLINRSPRNLYQNSENRVALILPAGYGSGFRNVNDKIWGLWPADNCSAIILNRMNTLTSLYGSKLDIIYDEPQFSYEGKYAQIFLWNSMS
jgi:hypothetical protein